MCFCNIRTIVMGSVVTNSRLQNSVQQAQSLQNSDMYMSTILLLVGFRLPRGREQKKSRRKEINLGKPKFEFSLLVFNSAIF